MYIYLIMVDLVIWTIYLSEDNKKNWWKYKNISFKALDN